jgi:histidyl-tRNA synthetase
LVRGLDYYTATVFELMTTSADLGTQNTLVAGGRYDNLISDLGGPPTPAVGFSIGLERTVLSLDSDAFARAPEIYVAALGNAARLRGLVLADELRRHGNWYVELEHRSVGMKAQFKRADKLGARFVVALGDTELAAGTVSLRDMRASEEISVKQEELAAELARRLSAEE